MKMRVALFYDQYARDFAQMVKIKNELAKHDAVCRIAPSAEMLEYAIIFKPDAIVIGNPDLYHGEYATLLSSKATVFSIPTEQSLFSAKIFAARIIEGHNKNNTDFESPNTAIVNKFFLWSGYHKEALLRAGIPEDKLYVSGNPRLSILDNKREVHCVGVPLETQFSHNLPYDLWALDGLDTGYGSMLDYWNLALNVLDAQLKVIRSLTKKGYKVIVRPRLSDMGTDYSFFGKNVEIDRTMDPTYLLNKCEIIVTGQSTIGLEAYVYGASVVTVLGMIKQSVITDPMKADLLFQHPLRPNTMEELLQILRESSSHRQSAEFRDQVRFYLGADISTPEKRIAEEVLRVMKEKPRRLINPTNEAALLRICNKFKGIKGVWIRNRDNVLGVLLSYLFLTKRRIRKRLSFAAVR